jgi:hypothetical protein
VLFQVVTVVSPIPLFPASLEMHHTKENAAIWLLFRDLGAGRIYLSSPKRPYGVVCLLTSFYGDYTNRNSVVESPLAYARMHE